MSNRRPLWNVLTPRWAVQWSPGHLALIPRADGERRKVNPQAAVSVSVEGDAADETAAACCAVFARSGARGLSDWLTRTLDHEAGAAFATGLWNAEAGGWYRSDGHMVQRPV